jgi:cell division protein ZapE
MHVRDGLLTHPSVLRRYEHLAETGRLSADPAQTKIAAALDRLIGDICEKRLARKSSALGWLFARRRSREPLIGLYIHGPVGTGKTMLMDLFFELVPARAKRRAHFNDFMADVHDRIGRQRTAFKNGESHERDPIPPVADALAQEAWVLCFDEFSVTDIADAMILSRLFSALFERGVVLVATSNVAPDDLYKNGLNRGLFEPFIGILKRHAQVLSVEAGKDYRLEKLQGMPVYMTPCDEKAARMMDEAWGAVTEGKQAHPDEVTVKGRKIQVPRAAGRSARFSFAELCDRPLAARDYMALAEKYDTFFIDCVPVMDDTRRNAAKRFILLIDTLYDTRRRVVLSAEAPPDQLYTGKSGNESFEFERTASRLFEMQSREWAAAHEADAAVPGPQQWKVAGE